MGWCGVAEKHIVSLSSRDSCVLNVLVLLFIPKNEKSGREMSCLSKKVDWEAEYCAVLKQETDDQAPALLFLKIREPWYFKASIFLVHTLIF